VPSGQVFQKQVDIFPAGMRDIAIREEWRNQEDFHGSTWTILMTSALINNLYCPNRNMPCSVSPPQYFPVPGRTAGNGNGSS